MARSPHFVRIKSHVLALTRAGAARQGHDVCLHWQALTSMPLAPLLHLTGAFVDAGALKSGIAPQTRPAGVAAAVSR